MFCEYCGGKLEGDVKFCPTCGAPVKANENKQKNNSDEFLPIKNFDSVDKNFKRILIVGVVLCTIAAAFFVYLNTPIAKMNRAIKAGNVRDAYIIFSNDIEHKKITSSMKDGLIDVAADTYRKFAAEQLSYTNALGTLNEIKVFVNSATDSSEEDREVQQLQKKLDYYSFLINMLDTGSSSPRSDIYNYREALKLDESGKEAKEGLARAETEYKTLVSKNVSRYESIGDFETAKATLVEALGVLPEDSQLMASLNSLEDRKQQYIEQGKGTGDLLDNGWDCVQSSLLSYGYDELPVDFFSEGIMPPAIEFTSEEEGFINIVDTEEVYRASFTYSVNGNFITIMPNPNGVYPVTEFAGKTEIVLELMAGGNLCVNDYSPKDGTSIGFTELGDVFDPKAQDSVPTPVPYAEMTTIYSIDGDDLLSLYSPNGYANEVQLNNQNRLMISAKYLIKDGWIYGRGWGTDYKPLFMKARLDASDLTLLGSNVIAEDIYVIGEYIYYLDTGEDYGIYRLNISTNEVKLIKKVWGNMKIVNDAQIYYNDEYADEDKRMHLHRCDLDGKNDEVVLAKPVEFTNILSDCIIYQDETDNETLHICDLNGGNDRRLTNVEAENPMYDGAYIYYQQILGDSESIWRCKPDGTENVQVSHCYAPWEYVLTSKYIYFVNGSDDYRLYRMKKDGSELTKITEDTYTAYIEIHGNKIIYFKYADEWEYVKGVYVCDLDGSNVWEFEPNF